MIINKHLLNKWYICTCIFVIPSQILSSVFVVCSPSAVQSNTTEHSDIYTFYHYGEDAKVGRRRKESLGAIIHW